MPSNSREVSRAHLIGIAALAGALVLLYVFSAAGGFPLDDSWIHQNYGRNLGQRGEWAFLAGVPSAASTSPLYTVVLGIGYRLGIPILAWTHGMGAAALALGAFAGYAFTRRIGSGGKRTPVLTGAALALSWHLIWAAVSGMETMLFSALGMVALLWAWREWDEGRSMAAKALIGRGVVFGALCGLTALTRPEGMLIAIIGGLWMLALRPQGTWGRVVVYGAAAAAAFIIVLTPYLLFNLQVTGGLLPNTAAAKQAYARPVLAESIFLRIALLIKPLLAGGHVLLVPGMIAFVGWAIWHGKQDSRALVALMLPAWAVGHVLLYAVTLPLGYEHGRYVIPALPPLIVIGVVGAEQLMRGSRRTMLGRVVTRVWAISTVLVWLVFGLLTGRGAFANDVRIINEEMVTQAAWISLNIPPDELLVIHDIGAVGYFTPRPMLDVAGLITPEIIPLIGEPEAMWALIRERDGRYVMGFPYQIPERTNEIPALCPLFTSAGTAAVEAGGEKMTLFAVRWDGNCENES